MSIALEEWRPIPDEDGYEVSSFGRVRSLPRVISHAYYGEAKLKGKMLKPKANHDGYPRVRVRRNHRLVHNLVLEAFIGPRPEGMQACHNDGNPGNATLTNLRWDTPSANVRDRIRHGTYQYGDRNPMSKSWAARRAQQWT